MSCISEVSKRLNPLSPPLRTRTAEGGGGIRLSALVPRNPLDFTAVPVLAFGDVQVPHAVIDQLVSASIDHSVPVDQPHHPWLWISSDSAAESRTSTFRSAHCFWFCHKARLELFRFGLQE